MRDRQQPNPRELGGVERAADVRRDDAPPTDTVPAAGPGLAPGTPSDPSSGPTSAPATDSTSDPASAPTSDLASDHASDPTSDLTPDDSGAARRRRRAQFLRDLNEAKALRERVKPRQARAARMRQQMRMRTFRW